MAFFIGKNRAPRLEDLSDNDKRKVFSAAEAAIESRSPDRKERNFIENRIGVPITRLADFQSFMDVGYKRVWASFRACHLVANTLMSATIKAKQRAADGTLTELDGKHAANVLLTTPNPYDSFEDITYMWTFHMKLCGTAYWLKDEIDGRGAPAYIYPLLPQYIESIPDPKTKVSGYNYKVNGNVIKLTPEQVMVFRRPSPNGFLTGVGDVEPATDLFQSVLGRNDLEKKFLENGAQPSGIMTRRLRENESEPDDTVWEAFKKKFNALYGGKNNTGKTAFLSGDWQYIKLGLTMQEMQAIEREKWSIEQIFLTHGVPLSVAGLKEASNYATARQDFINFRKHECVPLLDSMIGRLNMANGLGNAFGDGVVFDYDLSGLVDIEQTVKDYGPLVELASLTPNDLRVMCGLGKIDDPYLDQYFIKQGLVPVTVAGMTGGGNQQSEEIKRIISGVEY